MVFDPSLPADVLTGLRSNTAELYEAAPGTEPRFHQLRRERIAAGAVVWCLVVAVTSVAAYAAGPVLAWVIGMLGVFAYVPWNAVDRRANINGVLAIQGLLSLPLFLPLGISFVILPDLSPGTAILRLAVLGLLPYGTFVGPGRLTPGDRACVVGRDRFVRLSQLSYKECQLLRRVQSAYERVAEAQRLLAPAFDAGEVLKALHEQAWRLASRMAELAPLTREVDRLSKEAATEHVRASLRPQAEAVAAARAADAAVVRSIEDYIHPVDRAVRAHREWEQIHRIADLADSGAALSALAQVDAVAENRIPAPDLESDLGLEAARLARQELTAEAMSANTRLLDALNA
ncbi:hypothetical protein [Streptomyces sp. MS06]|uniref:hypothetical protein n=1 Tax=Streptomyces sp. MS06 TaxID=3385974 RepID=UPI0039A02B99